MKARSFKDFFLPVFFRPGGRAAEVCSAVLLTALLCRALFDRLGWWLTERMWPDEALYAWFAKKIFENPWYIFSPEANRWHPPLSSALFSLGHFISAGEAGPRAVVLLVNLAGIWLVYCLGRMVAGRFAGLTAAALLAAQGLYFTGSNMILNDSVLAVGMTVIAIFLCRFSPDKKQHWFILLALAWAVCGLKGSAVIHVVPWLAVFLLFRPGRGPAGERIKAGAVFSFFLLAACAVFFINLKINFTHFTEGVVFTDKPVWLYFYYALILAGMVWPGFIFAGAGLLLVRKDKLPALIILAWIIAVLVPLSLSAEKDLRYMLPAVPAVILLGAAGLTGVMDIVFKKEGVKKISKFFLIIILLFLPPGKAQIMNRIRLDNIYTGFQPAGEFLRRDIEGRIEGGAVILAGSPRAIRYYSDFEYVENGGIVQKLPASVDKLGRLASGTVRDIYLVVDFWEYTQPGWARDLAAGEDEILRDYPDFKPVFEVERDIVKPGNRRAVVKIYHKKAVD
jgi:hypothetical protein